TDHQCVDGLTCQVDSVGNFSCSNYNLNREGEKIFAFHDRRICASSGLDHSWPGSHREANWDDPGNTYFSSPNDGFVRQNEPDKPAQIFYSDTIGFFTQDNLPFYSAFAQPFPIDDRSHPSVIGPPLPTRLYYRAPPSFGHPPPGEEIPPTPA